MTYDTTATYDMTDTASADQDQPDARQPNVGGIAADRLLGIIERYERLEEEKKALGSDQKDLMTEATSAGFDAKIIKQLISLRKMDPDKLAERDALLEVYRRAISL